MATVKRVICGIAFLSIGWVTAAYAQFGVGTSWVRTDAQGNGMTLTIEACCNGGLRLIYLIPAMNGQPVGTLTVDSALDGKDAPAMVAGKPSGETMALKRIDLHHYTAVVKMNGKPLGTYDGIVAADNKTMNVQGILEGGVKTTETWVRK